MDFSKEISVIDYKLYRISTRIRCGKEYWLCSQKEFYDAATVQVTSYLPSESKSFSTTRD